MSDTTTPARSWRDHIAVHPAAELFDMLNGDDLQALADDIKKNKLQSPPVFLKAKGDRPRQLLDGRNRLNAMELAGLTVIKSNGALAVQIEETETDDPAAYVISANIHRRHLSTGDRKRLLKELLRAHPEWSDRKIAKAAGVDHKTAAAKRAEAEASGEIPHHEDRTGANGVKQPASKPPADKAPAAEKTSSGNKPPAASTGTKPPTAAAQPAALAKPPTVPASQVRSQAVAAFAKVLHLELAETLEDTLRMVKDEGAGIEKLPTAKRVGLVRGFMQALNVSLDDLRPVGQAS